MCKRINIRLCAKRLCTSAENKTKLVNHFPLKLCWICAQMNEYLVCVISATRLQVVWIYSCNMQEKTHCNLTAKTDTDVPSDLRHFAYKQIATVTISKQKTLFYTSNATSTFITVVFSINCSQTFALSNVRCVAILNWKLHITQKQVSTSNHQKHYLCSNRYICTPQQSSYFFQ